MGVVETVGAVAVTLTALIGLIVKLVKDAKAKKAQAIANSLNEISLKLENAKTDQERIEYAKQRAEILSRK